MTALGCRPTAWQQRLSSAASQKALLFFESMGIKLKLKQAGAPARCLRITSTSGVSGFRRLPTR